MNVQASDTGRTYRCSFFEVQSRIATLTVLIPEGKGFIRLPFLPLESNAYKVPIRTSSCFLLLPLAILRR